MSLHISCIAHCVVYFLFRVEWRRQMILVNLHCAWFTALAYWAGKLEPVSLADYCRCGMFACCKLLTACEKFSHNGRNLQICLANYFDFCQSRATIHEFNGVKWNLLVHFVQEIYSCFLQNQFKLVCSKCSPDQVCMQSRKVGKVSYSQGCLACAHISRTDTTSPTNGWISPPHHSGCVKPGF